MWLLSDSFDSFIYLMHLQVSFQLLLALINLLCSYVLVFVWRKLLVPPSHFLCMWMTLVTNCKVYIFICSPQNPKKRKTHNGRARAATVVVGVTIAAAANLNFVCLLLLFLFLPVLLYARNWEPNFIWKKMAEWKQANDICFTAANWNWREGKTQRDTERDRRQLERESLN